MNKIQNHHSINNKNQLTQQYPKSKLLIKTNDCPKFGVPQVIATIKPDRRLLSLGILLCILYGLFGNPLLYGGLRLLNLFNISPNGLRFTNCIIYMYCTGLQVLDFLFRYLIFNVNLVFYITENSFVLFFSWYKNKVVNRVKINNRFNNKVKIKDR